MLWITGGDFDGRPPSDPPVPVWADSPAGLNGARSPEHIAFVESVTAHMDRPRDDEPEDDPTRDGNEGPFSP